MSEAELFTELTTLVDVDPFALLGLSVSADEKRIAKRYRNIAKQLHPDALANPTGTPDADHLDVTKAARVIARIVNPSYQNLKHDKTRQEILTTLRFRVRRLDRTKKLVPTFPSAQELTKVTDSEVNIFYEQALSQLAEGQFYSMSALHNHSLEIGQLNLIFLSRKMESLVIRPKRTGLMTNAVTPTSAGPASIGRVARPAGVLTQGNGQNDTAGDTADNPPEVDYVKKHTHRAKTYLVKKNYEMAVQELREAIKIDPQSPELHSMIGQVYYKQKLSGMAKTHFRQALKLKPTHKIAQKYGKLLGLSEESPQQTTQKPEASETPAKKPWLGRLLKR
ncbi:MAG: tetratricopeptide repeat protein [Cyanobacteria bacterium P01_F01_bin.53]